MSQIAISDSKCVNTFDELVEYFDEGREMWVSSATFTYEDMILNLYRDTEPVRVANMLHDSEYQILDPYYMIRYHKWVRVGHEYFSYNYDFTDPLSITYSKENWSSEETHGVLVRSKRVVLWSGHVQEFVKEYAPEKTLKNQ